MKRKIRIFAKDRGLFPGNDKKAAFQLGEILRELKGNEGVELCFEEGIYHFYPDFAVERWLNISNHDDEMTKKIVFDLDGFQGLTIQGNHTTFMFHTDVIPFHIHQCQDIIIEGITINYNKPGYSQGIVQYADETRMEITIDKDKYDYEIVDGRIYFKGENYRYELVCGGLEMDALRHAPAYDVHDIGFYSGSKALIFHEKEEELVEVLIEDKNAVRSIPKVGNYLILRHHPRTHPAIFLSESADIILKNIMLHHCLGMAVIAQFTENIRIDHFDLRLPPNSDQVFTASADGFHFVYCKGKIEIIDCFLENQLDDPVNIHGIYGKIHEILSDREIIVQLSERQQKGIRLGKEGQNFRFADRETMLPIAENRVEKVIMINQDYQYYRFRENLPECHVADVIENLEYVPDVLIQGCTFQNNRARGLLLTSAGEVMITENRFRNAGAAILIEGDSNYWFESGAINHIVVKKNCFENCAYVSDWGRAPIQVSPSAKKQREGVRYHKCLEIIENDFYCFDERILSAGNIETIIFENNRIYKTKAFPPMSGKRAELNHILTFTEKHNHEF